MFRRPIHARPGPPARPAVPDAADTLAAMAETERSTSTRRATGSLPRLPSARPLGLALLVAIGTFLWAAGWSGPGGAHRGWPALAALVQGGSVALLWLAMAAGFGGVLADRLLGPTRASRGADRFALELALGVACGFLLDLWLGSLGLLTALGGVVAWVPILVGAILFLLRWRRGDMPWPKLPSAANQAWLPIAVAVPLALLLLAAASEPGWLWASEFGGYDALSYHLQLPKEWLSLGRVATLEHNAYSGLPSAFEATVLHLFVLANGPATGAIAAQYLAVGGTLLTAVAIGGLANRVLAPDSGHVGWIAAALYLGTPWVVVVGSLAYNDGFIPLFLVGGLLLILAAPRGAALGIGLAILFAAAFGAKPTAIGFAVAPMVLFVALRSRRASVLPILIAGAGASILLAPWLVRNGLATGNPFHPFAERLFGSGRFWSADQSAIFRRAHEAQAGPIERVGLLVQRTLLFGFGRNPAPGEPWIPLWSLLPFLGVIGVVQLALRRSTRTIGLALAALLAVQCFFWLGWTHLQSRFLLPATVPLAVAAAHALRVVAGFLGTRAIAAMLVAWSLLPLWVYRHERPIDDGSGGVVGTPSFLIGGSGFATGDAFAEELARATDPAVRTALLESAPVALFVNHLLPAGERVLLFGDARPFHLRRPVVYTTVWDRGPLDRVAARLPERPEAWAAALREEGFRFVIVDVAMLDRWMRSGWLNPRFTVDAIRGFIGGARVVHRFPNNALLLDLGPADGAVSPAGTG